MSFKDINILASNVSESSELLPFFLSLLVFKKPPYSALGWFFIISTPLKIISMVTAMFQIHNMALFHLLAIVEVIALYCFYNRIIFNKPSNWLIIFILVSVNLVNSIFNENINEFNSTAWSIDIMFLICLGMGFLYRIYQDMESIQLEKSPLFVINTGLLIYFSGSLFTYILGSKILSKESLDFFYNAWVIQSLANTTKNIVVSYGLWMARSK